MRDRERERDRKTERGWGEPMLNGSLKQTKGAYIIPLFFHPAPIKITVKIIIIKNKP
jgi:hypothetical protein